MVNKNQNTKFISLHYACRTYALKFRKLIRYQDTGFQDVKNLLVEIYRYDYFNTNKYYTEGFTNFLKTNADIDALYKVIGYHDLLDLIKLTREFILQNDMHDEFVPELLAVLTQIEEFKNKVSQIKLDRRDFDSYKSYNYAYCAEVDKIKEQLGTDLLEPYYEKYIKPHIPASAFVPDEYGAVHVLHLDEEFENYIMQLILGEPYTKDMINKEQEELAPEDKIPELMTITKDEFIDYVKTYYSDIYNSIIGEDELIDE